MYIFNIGKTCWVHLSSFNIAAGLNTINDCWYYWTGNCVYEAQEAFIYFFVDVLAGVRTSGAGLQP